MNNSSVLPRTRRPVPRLDSLCSSTRTETIKTKTQQAVFVSPWTIRITLSSLCSRCTLVLLRDGLLTSPMTPGGSVISVTQTHHTCAGRPAALLPYCLSSSRSWPRTPHCRVLFLFIPRGGFLLLCCCCLPALPPFSQWPLLHFLFVRPTSSHPKGGLVNPWLIPAEGEWLKLLALEIWILSGSPRFVLLWSRHPVGPNLTAAHSLNWSINLEKTQGPFITLF